MKTAVLIPPSGPVQILDVEEFSLEFMQDCVKGPIEAIGLESATMYLNEEGKIVDPPLPPNDIATRLLHEAGGIPWDTVLGNVIIVGPPDDDGDDTSLSTEWVQFLKGASLASRGE